MSANAKLREPTFFKLNSICQSVVEKGVSIIVLKAENI